MRHRVAARWRRPLTPQLVITWSRGRVGPREDVGMALHLAPEEPEAGPWRVALLTVVAQALTRSGPGRIVSGRPVVLAIDGRSNSGKTKLPPGSLARGQGQQYAAADRRMPAGQG